MLRCLSSFSLSFGFFFLGRTVEILAEHRRPQTHSVGCFPRFVPPTPPLPYGLSDRPLRMVAGFADPFTIHCLFFILLTFFRRTFGRRMPPLPRGFSPIESHGARIFSTAGVSHPLVSTWSARGLISPFFPDCFRFNLFHLQEGMTSCALLKLSPRPCFAFFLHEYVCLTLNSLAGAP